MFLSFAAKAETTTTTATEHTVAAKTIAKQSESKNAIAILEETSISQSDQQNESQPNFSTDYISKSQNQTFYIPVLNNYTKTALNAFTKKEQLLKVIFPFHFFY
ncbi:hypothetical protein [Neptunitalea lumnitzerae]|uniref:Uncharacterized protein n=1 Tax=Neptunitalea lumnitzerae TaxID=2965509 RepID=A0ABQ5MFP3_9FLAO|nr:hypothetical protein [Neptunitalea sp. Y10]GLB48225.1 hypothetical protein Y10_05930 [Neptunitalea sp. Y10]